MTSLLIGLLVPASIACTLVVPIYARVTPHVGDFPFFYFYLLAYMPVVAVALWVVTPLQRPLNNGRLNNCPPGNPTGGRREATPNRHPSPSSYGLFSSRP